MDTQQRQGSLDMELEQHPRLGWGEQSAVGWMVGLLVGCFCGQPVERGEQSKKALDVNGKGRARRETTGWDGSRSGGGNNRFCVFV